MRRDEKHRCGVADDVHTVDNVSERAYGPSGDENERSHRSDVSLNSSGKFE
jgi:hypothetical protein